MRQKNLNEYTQKFHHPCNNQIQQNQNSPKNKKQNKIIYIQIIINQ
jgi:hypothetical protein